MEKAILTRAEAIKYLGIGEKQFDRHVKAKRIPHWPDEDTGWKRYPKDALDAWLASYFRGDDGAQS